MRGWLLVGLVALICELAGCTLLAARPQVRLAEEASVIRGTIGGVHDAPVLVVALREPDLQPVDFFVVEQDGPYFLMVLPGRYRVLAFEDRNGDRILQQTETATWLPDGDTVVEASSQRAQNGVDGRLPEKPAGDDRLLELAVDLSNPDLDVGMSFGGPRPGTIANLEDDRFSRVNSQKGLWKPIDFLRDNGGGLFLLGPHDPDRIPVLFVHGAGGTPLEFAPLIETLDRETFEPWVFSYPSALRLEKVADYLKLCLLQLHEELEFERLVVVAHSMGGLVSRAMLNDLHAQDEADWIPLFVTLATPWGGHAAAEVGVQRSPVVLPSWRDMAPSSQFLEDLLDVSLAEETRFHLLFAFSGHRGRNRSGGSNDGVVTIESQLATRAQDQAAGVRGYAASHTGILLDPDAAKMLGSLLQDATDR
ncbi:MAG: alpha/beta fold hydrolase [Deltaproteobacteria bacterium]|nr:alpha/beta fold hydrolase [Deltaproteobacteria bacterium]